MSSFEFNKCVTASRDEAGAVPAAVPEASTSMAQEGAANAALSELGSPQALTSNTVEAVPQPAAQAKDKVNIINLNDRLAQ